MLDAGAGTDLDGFRHDLVAFYEILIDPKLKLVGRSNDGPIAFRAQHGKNRACLEAADLRGVSGGLSQDGGSRSRPHPGVGGGGHFGCSPEDGQNRYKALETFHGPAV